MGVTGVITSAINYVEYKLGLISKPAEKEEAPKGAAGGQASEPKKEEGIADYAKSALFLLLGALNPIGCTSQEPKTQPKVNEIVVNSENENIDKLSPYGFKVDWCYQTRGGGIHTSLGIEMLSPDIKTVAVKAKDGSFYKMEPVAGQFYSAELPASFFTSFSSTCFDGSIVVLYKDGRQSEINLVYMSGAEKKSDKLE